MAEELYNLPQIIRRVSEESKKYTDKQASEINEFLNGLGLYIDNGIVMDKWEESEV